MQKKVMVAMSGGVDSSVAAYILKGNGFCVSGATLKLVSGNYNKEASGNSKPCCSLGDIEDARNVCHKLDITHHVFNFTDIFENYVIKNFVSSYQCGETPNPCIDCNKYIKFDALLKRAKLLEQDYMSTGHYAIISKDASTGRYILKKAKDASKDQSYALYSLTQEQLSRTLFPLGQLTKNEVREIAASNNFGNARKPDSQDICFVDSNGYGKFIEGYTGEKPATGNFLDTKGNIIGTHKGQMYYTIGQRKGLGIWLGKPAYVCKKDAVGNTVTVGCEGELYSKTFSARDVNFIPFDSISAHIKAAVRTRYSCKEQNALIHQTSPTTVTVELESPQRAITSGQAVVFYDGDIVVGGGTIN